MPQPIRRKRWWQKGDAPTWVGVAVAIVGVVLTYSQFHLAAVQNTSQEKDSLASLVSDIAQQSQLLATASLKQQGYIDTERSVDASQALALVRSLGDQVPAVDDLEIGLAFQGADDDSDALDLLELARHHDSNPYYTAQSLQTAAVIRYQFHQLQAAEGDITLAFDAFRGKQDIAKSAVLTNFETTKLIDAYWQAQLPGCGTAVSDYEDAYDAIEKAPQSRTSQVVADESAAIHELLANRTGCHASHRMLTPKGSAVAPAAPSPA